MWLLRRSFNSIPSVFFFISGTLYHRKVFTYNIYGFCTFVCTEKKSCLLWPLQRGKKHLLKPTSQHECHCMRLAYQKKKEEEIKIPFFPSFNLFFNQALNEKRHWIKVANNKTQQLCTSSPLSAVKKKSTKMVINKCNRISSWLLLALFNQFFFVGIHMKFHGAFFFILYHLVNPCTSYVVLDVVISFWFNVIVDVSVFILVSFSISRPFKTFPHWKKRAHNFWVRLNSCVY